MRWRSILFDLAVVILLWTVVLVATRQRRLRVVADPSPQRMRGYRLHTAALISVAVGVTWFIAWLASDGMGLQWLHSLSLPAALLFIALGSLRLVRPCRDTLVGSAVLNPKPQSMGAYAVTCLRSLGCRRPSHRAPLAFFPCNFRSETD